MALQVVMPEEYLGDVIGDLTSKRAKITGVEAENYQMSKAHVPLAELFGYSTFAFGYPGKSNLHHAVSVI